MPRKTTLRVGGVPEHFNLPWHLAIESGAFAAEGLHVVYQDYPGGTGALTRALKAKELDVAVVLTEGITQAILKGNPSRIIKTYVESPLIWGIHVPAKSNLQEVGDIQGKRYAISRFGSGSHLMAIVDTVQRGWDASQIHFVQIGNLEGARKAFANGTADVFLWEKFMTKPLVDNGEFRRIGETTTPWPCFMIAARNDRIRRSAGALSKMLKVISNTCRELMASENAVEMIAQRYHLQEKDVAVWLSLTQWNVEHEPQPEALIKVIRSLVKAKVLDKEEAVEKVFFRIDKT